MLDEERPMLVAEPPLVRAENPLLETELSWIAEFGFAENS